jgi:hypothetical protein
MNSSRVNQRFLVFWREISKQYIRLGWKVLLIFLLVLTLGRYIMSVSVCVGDSSVVNYRGHVISQEVACEISHSPLSVFSIFYDKAGWLAVFYILIMLVGLFEEWRHFQKNEPSSMTLPLCSERPLDLINRKKELAQSQVELGRIAFDVQWVNDKHRRVSGHFHAEHVKAFVKKFAGFLNKPILQSDQSMHWKIHIRNGDVIQVTLQAPIDTPRTWVMQVDFLQWTGRATPPQLVESHFTEFVLQLNS